MIKAFLGAVQYLSIVPIRFQTAEPGRSATFFPLVGAGLGFAGALVLEQLRSEIPFPVAVLLVLAMWVVLTGGLHEDGFADCVDAFRAGRPRHRILEILKDSRVGAHASLALAMSALIRWQALSTIATPLGPALAAVHGLPRAAIVALAWTTPPVGSGSGNALSQSLTTAGALAAIVQGVALAMLCGDKLASILLGGTIVIVLLARQYFMIRIGGFTGDCLGATEHILETFCLLVFTCRSCIS